MSEKKKPYCFESILGPLTLGSRHSHRMGGLPKLGLRVRWLKGLLRLINAEEGGCLFEGHPHEMWATANILDCRAILGADRRFSAGASVLSDPKEVAVAGLHKDIVGLSYTYSSPLW